MQYQLEMEKDKTRQHYVWKKYLEPWTLDGKLWCKRGNTIFNPSLDNIAVERYFYLAEALNDVEKKIISSIIQKMHPSGHSILLGTFDGYCIASETSEYSKKNDIENYHDFIEHSINNILDRLYEKNRNILKNDKMKINFCYFIGMQYTRTKKTFQAITSNLKTIQPPEEIVGKYHAEKMAKVFALIYADIIGNWIYSKANIYFLESGSNCTFITSDQPVFNIHTSDTISMTPPNEMELFYPITPRLALFITEKVGNDRLLSKQEVLIHNQRIIERSNEQVYAIAKEMLDEHNINLKSNHRLQPDSCY